MPVRKRDTLAERLQALHTGGMTWRAIAREFPGVAPGTLCAIAKGYEPKKDCIRQALGLPVLVRVKACAHCGRVHLAQRCPARRPALARCMRGPRLRRLADLPVETLARMIRERIDA